MGGSLFREIQAPQQVLEARGVAQRVEHSPNIEANYSK